MSAIANEYLPAQDPAEPAASTAGGWFRAMRTPEAMELLQASPHAFRLAYVIAYRGQYRDGFNQHNIKLGEALLGDFKAYGMTQQQYRTAKSQLARWHFATFRATNRGTVGKLVDTRLFSLFRLECNDPNNTRVTSKQRTGNDYQEHKNVRRHQKSPLTASNRISIERQLAQLRAEKKGLDGDLADQVMRETYPEKVQRQKALAGQIADLEAKLR